MDIREMLPGDCEAARALWHGIPGMGLGADDETAALHRFLAHNPGTCFVAEDAGALCGTALSGHDGRRGTVYHVCVAPAQRRTGLGKKLVNAALDALKQAGIQKARLLCFKNNPGGNAFWRAQGFSLREDLNYYDVQTGGAGL